MLRFLLNIWLWPFRVLGWLLGILFGPAARRIDSSPRLSVLINQISSSMATQRGLLLMLGTAVLVLSLVAHGIALVLMVASDSFDSNLYWLCIPVALLHLGILAGFTGTMLATPLGQGYKDH